MSLQYQFSTDPQPLQISTDVPPPATGTLNVRVSASTTTGYADKITLGVQVGSDAGALFSETPVAGVNTTRWNNSSTQIVPGEQLGLSGANYAQFIFNAQTTDDYKIDDDLNLVFSVSGGVATTSGNGTGFIVEDSGDDPTNLQPQPQIPWQVELAPPRLYVQNFMAISAPLVPCTQFAAGDKIVLEWESNGSWFELYAANTTPALWSGTDKTYTVPNGFTSDTTLVLVVSMNGGSGPVGDFEPVVIYETLTITISDPDSTPRTLNVTGAATLSGATTEISGAATLSGTTAVTGAATLSGTTNITGAATLSGPATDITGAATLSGTTDITGAATLSGPTTNITGAATLSGSTTMNQLTAQNGFDVTASNVKALSSTVQSGTFVGPDGGATQVTNLTAQTDSFLLLSISNAGQETAYGSVTFCSNDGWQRVVSGGITQGDGQQVTPSPNTATIPMRAGVAFTIYSQKLNNSLRGDFTASYIIFPLGPGS